MGTNFLRSSMLYNYTVMGSLLSTIAPCLPLDTRGVDRVRDGWHLPERYFPCRWLLEAVFCSAGVVKPVVTFHLVLATAAKDAVHTLVSELLGGVGGFTF